MTKKRKKQHVRERRNKTNNICSDKGSEAENNPTTNQNSARKDGIARLFLLQNALFRDKPLQIDDDS